MLFVGVALALSGCSKDDKGDEYDDFLRCSKCNKILTTDYYVCTQCRSNICPSCIKRKSDASGHKWKICPKCGHQWR